MAEKHPFGSSAFALTGATTAAATAGATPAQLSQTQLPQNTRSQPGQAPGGRSSPNGQA